jgi:hypothetical protein
VSWPGQCWQMIQRAARAVLLSRVLLVLSALASVVVAAIVGLIVYLLVESYSGGSSPTSIAPLAFPVALVLFLIAGLPAMGICAALWIAYGASVPRRARTGIKPSRRRDSKSDI